MIRITSEFRSQAISAIHQRRDLLQIANCDRFLRSTNGSVKDRLSDLSLTLPFGMVRTGSSCEEEKNRPQWPFTVNRRQHGGDRRSNVSH
eukprot:scaffold34604_cov164-Amphora_coffeaeformis.AAC.14